MLVAGADGCGDGWIVATADQSLSSPIVVSIVPSIADSLQAANTPRVLAVDIPIGLTQCGDRRADIEARKVTPQSSVFQPAKRPILDYAREHGLLKSTPANRAALREWCRDNGHSMSGSHSYALYERTAELDTLVRVGRNCDIREVHPEVCFWALNGKHRLRFRKKTAIGAQERRRLLNSVFGVEVLDLQLPRGKAAMDDLFDALAALWTAARVARGKAQPIPYPPGRDLVLNRDVAIWY